VRARPARRPHQRRPWTGLDAGAGGAGGAGLRGDRLLEADWEEVDRDNGSVLTLERLVQLSLSAGRRVELHIETKHPTRYGGLVEKALVELLERYGLAHPASRADSLVTVMSFAPTSLRRIHVMAPTLPTVLLMSRVPLRYRDGSLPPRIGIAAPSLAVVKAHPRYVERVHARGNRLHVWTVDDEIDIKQVLALGVDAVISNHPRRVLRQLDRA
jgi:glycerophosphoryl diester phosphodiesterase